MNSVKRWIVEALETACDKTGHRRACVLARWSDSLDRRWKTGVWITCKEN